MSGTLRPGDELGLPKSHEVRAAYEAFNKERGL